jgi:hypothetical protein
MNKQERLEDIKELIVEQITFIINNKMSKKPFIKLAETINTTPEIHTDTILLQVNTILDFLAHQLENENAEYVWPHVVEEACIYVLSKIMELPYP